MKKSIALITVFGALSLTVPALAQESQLAALRADAQGRAPDAMLRLGRALRRAGHFDEAITTLRSAARGATRQEALWEIARVRFDQNDFRASQAACRALPGGRNARDPAGLLRHVCMARAYLVWHRVALAEREIAVATAIDPNHGELRLVVADAHRLANASQQAIEAYNAAASALPGRAEPYLGLGLLYVTSNRLDEALAALRRAVEVDPGDPAANLALGRFLLERRRDHAAALPYLRSASDNRPHWPEALVALGNAQLAAGSNADALANFALAVQLAPTEPGAQSGLGRARLASGQTAEAEAPLRAAIEQVPNDAEAQMALAELLARTDRREDALRQWDRAIDLLPGDPVPRMRAAELAHAMSQNSLARAYIDRILSDDPQYAPALLLRADIAFEENDRNNARQLYEAALRGHGPIDRARAQARLNEINAPQRNPRRR